MKKLALIIAVLFLASGVGLSVLRAEETAGKKEEVKKSEHAGSEVKEHAGSAVKEAKKEAKKEVKKEEKKEEKKETAGKTVN